MKHEPKPVIHMEMQLEWACKLVRTESLNISKAIQTVLSRLTESQIWHQPVSSMALHGEGSEKGQWPLLTDTRNFSLSQYATGALQAATLVLELRSESK